MLGPVVILIYDIESGGFTLSVGYFFQGDRSLMYQWEAPPERMERARGPRILLMGHSSLWMVA